MFLCIQRDIRAEHKGCGTLWPPKRHFVATETALCRHQSIGFTMSKYRIHDVKTKTAGAPVRLVTKRVFDEEKSKLLPKMFGSY